MQGPPEVVECLIKLLRGELAARDQYFLHSRYYEDFGLTHLYTRINHEMEEETQHADDILRRILFLEGTPDMRPDEIEPGTTVTEMLTPWPCVRNTVIMSPAICCSRNCATPKKTTPTG